MTNQCKEQGRKWRTLEIQKDKYLRSILCRNSISDLAKNAKLYYNIAWFQNLNLVHCVNPKCYQHEKHLFPYYRLLFSLLIKMFQMGEFLLSFYFLLLILANATQTLSIPFIVYVGIASALRLRSLPQIGV